VAAAAGQDPRRATEVAHGQRHLGLSHHTSGALHFFMRPKASRGAAQQLACTQMLAQLGHGNAAQGQGRRVVTQGHPLESAERITGCKCAGGGGNQGVHSAKVTAKIVTLALCAAAVSWPTPCKPHQTRAPYLL
jgi:hypothetical protein